MTKPCAMCGTRRHRSDLGQVDGRWFCHPRMSTGATCYTAQCELDADDRWWTART